MSPGVYVASAEAEQTGAGMGYQRRKSPQHGRSCVLLREELSVRSASLGP